MELRQLRRSQSRSKQPLTLLFNAETNKNKHNTVNNRAAYHLKPHYQRLCVKAALSSPTSAEGYFLHLTNANKESDDEAHKETH